MYMYQNFMPWFFSMLVLVYTAFSMVQISYQAYAIDLADDVNQRTRITAYREGLGLLGVFIAAALPQILSDASDAKTGFAQYSFIFAPTLLLAVVVTVFASPPALHRAAQITHTTVSTWHSMWAPLQNKRFRKLLIIFIVNGIAASIPATLVLFFIDHVLRTPQHTAALLCAYFAAGAAGMPLWIALSKRYGKTRSWLLGMAVSIAAFVWAFMLGEGDVWGFAIICILSGLGLGADLAIPPALVADVIDDDIAKGYETEDGEMVILTDDDMAALPSTSSREIAVEKFVPRDQIDPLLLEKSYYLEPDKSATKPYALLRDALKAADRMAIVTVSLRARMTMAVLRVRDDVIVMQTMLWPDEVRSPDFARLDGETDAKPAELKMANLLVESLAGDYVPDDYVDDYQAAVEAVVKAKLDGGEVQEVPAAKETGGEVVDLLAALQRSVERAKAARGEAS